MPYTRLSNINVLYRKKVLSDLPPAADKNSKTGVPPLVLLIIAYLLQQN